MNGVNWCKERMQGLEFNGSRQSEATVVTAAAEQLKGKQNVEYFCSNNVPVTAHYV